MLSAIVRGSLRAVLSSRYRAFDRSLAAPADVQSHVLRRISRQLARTDYGKSLGVHGAETYSEFAHRVPVVDYDEILPWIELQASSHRPILAAEPIVVYEETSGSSGSHKLVPYTASLLSSFDSMFRLWVYDLLAHGPELRSGKTFISISPPVREKRFTPSGIPIGFDDDTLYLSRTVRWLLGSRFLFPAGLDRVRSYEEYRRALAAWLAAESDLEVISVWSPTYLIALLDWISNNRAVLIADLARGRIEVDGGEIFVPSGTEVMAVLDHDDPVDWMKVWPRLKLLSCWADGASSLFIGRLRDEFPGVMIQPKGLLATEAPVTLPLCAAAAPVPLLGDVFLEFESLEGDILRLHELEVGREYSVIVTQTGGLVRYRLNDQVRCEGLFRATPCLRFLGRTRDVSDLVGEKLHERFVREVVGRILGKFGAFTFFVPVVRSGQSPHYLCITDSDAVGGLDLAQVLEQELQQAVQYRAARGLDQLGPVKVVERPDARERYTRLFLGRGMKWGDIKFRTLIPPPSEAELEDLIS